MLKSFLAFIIISATVLMGLQIDAVHIAPSGDMKAEDIAMKVLVFEPGWKSTYQDASSTLPVAGFPKQDDSSFELRADYKLRSSGKTMKLHEKAVKSGDGYLFTYVLDNPEAAEFAGDHALSVIMPVAAVKGRVMSFDDKKVKLPEVFGGKYVIEQRECKKIVIPLAGGSIVLAGNFSVHIQDNRVFKGDLFEMKINFTTRGAGLTFMMYRVAEGAALPAIVMPPPLLVKITEAGSPYAVSAPVAVTVAKAAAVARQNERYDMILDVSGTFENPFDPDEIDVSAQVTLPSGKTMTLPAFFEQPYTVENGKETASGKPHFTVRFLPVEAGKYSVRITAKDKNGAAQSGYMFTAAAASAKGFIRTAPNKKYFMFENGDTYFPVGHNVCWAKSIAEYDNYFTKMAAAGENFSRIWIGPFDIFTLERTSSGVNDYAGLTKYDLKNAWRFDYILDAAAAKNIYLMYCIESFNSFKSKPQHNVWHKCPYNKEFGGPCDEAQKFFTDAEAKKIFKKRLRYILARYGYSANIFAWEFFNEVELTDKYNSADNSAWHKEMAQYLRSIDPYRHLISTSYGRTEGDPAVDGLAEMDFAQSHNYGAGDAATMMRGYCIDKSARYGKPHFFGEFGADVRGGGDVFDTEGINLHNGLFAPVFSLGAGTGMLWWWDNYIEPQNLYHVFTPVAAFVRDIPFAKQNFAPASISLQPTTTYTPDIIILEGKYAKWEEHASTKPLTVTVAADGKISGDENLSRVIHGTKNHAKLHNPVTFMVDYPKQGKFSVLLSGVSDYGGAKLKVYRDGKLIVDKDLLDDNETRTGTMTNYNGVYAIDVPEGRHEILVDNDGNDWITVGYSFELPSLMPPLESFGLVDRASEGLAAIAWFKHKVNTYSMRVTMKAALSTVSGASFSLAGLRDGDYRIEWWDTYKGVPVSTEKAQVKRGALNAAIPVVDKDIACKVFTVK
ncbi:MAG: cellulase family glycosylhydrolase [Spirochaetes bacterium]|nr:cellulase family glycosylhydrolase [Spirochaetota bacterium]